MRARRNGPRPLAMHLMAAGTISASSLSAWPLLRSGWMPLNGNLAEPGRALQKELAAANPEAFSTALTDELMRRHDAFLSGIETYRDHPYSRTIEDPPPLWERGPAKLLDYGITDRAGTDGTPLLVVPSMINRGYILDLTVENSFLRFLAGRGFRPLLVDWGTPDEAWLARDLSDILSTDLVEMLETATETAGGAPVTVIGYCMGGTMATALAALSPDRVSALVLLAAPWDFHADDGGPPPFVAAGRPMLENLLSALGCLPVDVLQMLFLSIDMAQSWEKFRRFGAAGRDTETAEMFVALEDWLNDGVPLGAQVARECLFGWYGDNLPMRGEWQVAGRPVRPSEIDMPALAVVPSQDRIVPPASAAALAAALPRCETLSPSAGHIGMMVGSRALTKLWQPTADWLRENSVD
jgi:polyhydroxyalkanoate synthase